MEGESFRADGKLVVRKGRAKLPCGHKESTQDKQNDHPKVPNAKAKIKPLFVTREEKGKESEQGGSEEEELRFTGQKAQAQRKDSPSIGGTLVFRCTFMESPERSGEPDRRR